MNSQWNSFRGEEAENSEPKVLRASNGRRLLNFMRPDSKVTCPFETVLKGSN